MKLKLNKNQHRLPIGGHHFFVDGRMFRGGSLKEVVYAIREYRTNNCIHVGDPEQEVLRHYQRNWPFMVEPDLDAKETPLNEKYTQWRDWVWSTWKNAPKRILTASAAEPRWKSCEDCPFNVKMEWEDTPESTRAEIQAYLMRRSIAVPDFLQFCACHKADLGLFTMLEDAKEYSGNKDPEKQPSYCWVK